MARKSVTKRIKFTKRGKVKRQPMGIGHAKSNKSVQQRHRRKGARSLEMSRKAIKNLMN